MRRSPQNPYFRHVTLLCVLLLALTGLAQAMHLHPQDTPRGDADKMRCSLCLAGQTPQQATAKVDVLPLQPSEPAAVPATKGFPQSGARPAACIRPPPAA